MGLVRAMEPGYCKVAWGNGELRCCVGYLQIVGSGGSQMEVMEDEVRRAKEKKRIRNGRKHK